MRVRDARQTFLGIWVRNLIEGKPILVFGDGLQLRDFNFVDDVVDALIMTALSDKANGEIFNLGSSEVINLKDLAAILCTMFKSGHYDVVPFPPERKAIDIGDYYSDFTKINKLLDWKPKISLKEGLLKTLDYYSLHHEHYWE